MYIRLFQLVLIPIIFLSACKDKPTDLHEVDQLIKQKLYGRAGEILNIELAKDFSDTLHYSKIKNRLNIIQRLQFFKSLDDLTEQNKWQRSQAMWLRLKSSLNDSLKETRRLYGFALFHKKSMIDSALRQTDSYWQNLRKSVLYPTTSKKLLRGNFEKLGLQLAEQDSIKKARIMFDKSFRMIRISTIDKELSAAYFLYMEGKFRLCLAKLNQVSDKNKDAHWRRLEEFLTLYTDKLTLDERFKLW